MYFLHCQTLVNTVHTLFILYLFTPVLYIHVHSELVLLLVRDVLEVVHQIIATKLNQLVQRERPRNSTITVIPSASSLRLEFVRLAFSGL